MAPGRVIGQIRLKSNEPIESDPLAYLNLIHVDDAAELLLAMAQPDHRASIELGCDDSPHTKHDYYHWLADRLGTSPPVFTSSGNRSASSSKICSNSITCRRTGWRPKFPSFKDGLSEILKDAGRLGA